MLYGLRFWLLKKIAGKAGVLLNAEVEKGMVLVDHSKGFFVDNVTWRGPRGANKEKETKQGGKG